MFETGAIPIPVEFEADGTFLAAELFMAIAV
jgi:hypothetical protein